MKVVTTCLALQLALASPDALAQTQAQDKGDAIEKLRTCATLARDERLDCLDKLSRDIAPAPANPAPSATSETAPAVDNWIVSETMSPLDYSPVAIANATANNGPGNVPVRLSIQCRGGRTELVIASPALTLASEQYTVFYDIKDGQPVALAVGTPASGAGIAIRGNIVRLLTSLPDQGDVSFRVTARQGVIVEGRYALAGLKKVLGRLAAPCKWPTN